MTKQQAERIIEEIRNRKGIPLAAPVPPGQPGQTPRPYVPISVLMVSGNLFNGMGWVNTHGDIEMAVDRISEAHLSKGPISIWINIDNVQAITDA